MTESRSRLDRLIAQARAKHSDPEDARLELLGLVADADDDFRDDLAFAFARGAFDDAIRNDTLKEERAATVTPAAPKAMRRERRSVFDRPETPEQEASAQRFRDRVDQIMSDLKADLQMEWTRELLDSVFAVGDGTFVSWGEATVEQHEARIQMHAVNAEAAMEGWARHSQAVDAIAEAGVSCLNEIEGRLAA